MYTYMYMYMFMFVFMFMYMHVYIYIYLYISQRYSYPHLYMFQELSSDPAEVPWEKPAFLGRARAGGFVLEPNAIGIETYKNHGY